MSTPASTRKSQHFIFPSPKVPSHIIRKPMTPLKNVMMNRMASSSSSESFGDENSRPNEGYNIQPQPASARKIFTPRRIDHHDIARVEAKLKQYELDDEDSMPELKTLKPDLPKTEIMVEVEGPKFPSTGEMQFASKYECLEDLLMEYKNMIMPIVDDQCEHIQLMTQYLQHLHSKLGSSKLDVKHDELQKTPKILDTIDLTKDFEHPNKQNIDIEGSLVVKDVDGAFVTAYTPIRVQKKKERELLGADYVVSPVRRSTRKMDTPEIKKDFNVLLEKFGYAFSPNQYLPSDQIRSDIKKD